MCVAVALYLAAAFKFAVAAPLDLLVTSFVLVATVIVTIASYWHTHIRARVLGQTFLYAQALFDVALITTVRSEEHTSELQSHSDLVCRLLLEKKKRKTEQHHITTRVLH